MTQWYFGSLVSLFVALIALSTRPAHSWVPTTYRHQLVPLQGHATATQSPLFAGRRSRHRRQNLGQLFSSEKEDSEGTEAAASESKVTKTSSSTSGDDEEEKFGILRTILLAGPLFIKFTIVLLIKFVTDLIVFPLLWLYRLARLTKRKFLSMIGKGDRDYPNGEKSSP